jgi:branched-chain amino acid transport system permease protein
VKKFNSLPIWILLIVGVWIFNFTGATQIDPYTYSIIIYAGINVILAVSLNLVNGFTGQFSMGHAGFMSIGGYVSAFLSLELRQNYPQLFESEFFVAGFFLMAILFGGIMAAIAGYLVGLPSLRLKGDYLAIVTLGFGEIIRVIILNTQSVGGARGLPGIPQVSNFGWVFSFVLITIFVVWRLIHSQHGRALLAVREDEIAAEAMGVDTTKAKVRAFVVGAFFSGVAGVLFGHFLSYLNPQSFDFNRSFEIIIMVVLGGMGSITGSVVAALFLTFTREGLRSLQEITHLDFRMIIYSLILIVLMLTRPNGLFGTKEFFHFLPKWLRQKWGLKEHAS